KMTGVTSHELVEAITRPNVDGAGWQGYYKDANGNTIAGEIGDLTQDLPPSSGAMAIEDGYVVQKYWSQAAGTSSAGTSIAPGGTDYKNVPAMPVGIAGAEFSIQSLGSSTHKTTWLAIGNVTFDVLSRTGGFAATWTDGVTTYSTHGTLRVLGRSVAIRVTNPVTGGVLFTGVLTPADGNWTGGSLELLGTDASDATNMTRLTSFGVLV